MRCEADLAERLTLVVIRLGGKKVGLFSTRTPHRPNSIGLTVVKIEAVHEYVPSSAEYRFGLWWTLMSLAVGALRSAATTW